MTKKELKKIIKEEFENLINYGSNTFLAYQPRIQSLPKMRPLNLADDVEPVTGFKKKNEFAWDDIDDDISTKNYGATLTKVLNLMKNSNAALRSQLKEKMQLDDMNPDHKRKKEEIIREFLFLLNRMTTTGILSKGDLNIIINRLKISQSSFFNTMAKSSFDSVINLIMNAVRSKQGGGIRVFY